LDVPIIQFFLIAYLIGQHWNGNAKGQMVMIKTRNSKTLIEHFNLSKVA